MPFSSFPPEHAHIIEELGAGCGSADYSRATPCTVAEQKDSIMKNHIILGVDPGIANTGLGIVKANGTDYSLITAETVKTKSCHETGKCLSIIHDEINATLNAWKIDAIVTERVFHNRNATSSLTTGAVIKILQFIAHQRGLPIHEFTPNKSKLALASA